MLPKGWSITPKWAWLWSRDCLKNFAVCRDAARASRRFVSDSWATCWNYLDKSEDTFWRQFPRSFPHKLFNNFSLVVRAIFDPLLHIFIYFPSK